MFGVWYNNFLYMI